ncbi:MAG: hypothetical protein H6739_17410 [Alphaproteobacteria bacterium]|nr:hypothetical protein [Alphaproteobacteria bacterium]
MLLALALIACNKQPDDPVVDTGVVDDPGTYIYEESDPPAPSLSIAQVEDAITEAVVGAFDLNAQPVIAGYQAAMVGQEEGCPDYYANEDNTYWYDYCYSEDGSYFSGYGFIYHYDRVENGDGYLVSGDYVYLVADIVNGDGHAFSGSGAAYNVQMDWEGDTPHTLYYSIVQGTFSYDGPEVSGTWMDEDIAPDLTILAYWVPEDTSPQFHGGLVNLQGGVSGLSSEADTVVMDGVSIFQEGLASMCPIEPSGTISVRDPSGNWYDVIFDGPTEPGAAIDTSACDGCGAVFYRGERLGDACVDFSPLLDWEEQPW